jgi:hypothetical protein
LRSRSYKAVDEEANVMNAKILLCLPLVLTGAFMFSRAARASVIAPTNSSIIQIVNPQDSVELPKLGHAIFMEQSSGFSLQVPVGFRENGKRTDTNNPVLQAWLLKTDGMAVAQSGEPSIITMGSFGNYSTDFMFYQFSKVPENELSGVAVSVNGKLFCHEIERTNSGSPVAEGQTNSNSQWAPYTDPARHFHFQYPAAWKINTQVIPVMHYRDVFVSLNSAEPHTVADLQVSSNTWGYGAPETIKQLPTGAVYLDIGYWDGPWPRWGPRIQEMNAADISDLLKTNREDSADGLIRRQIEFSKWGRHWSICVYMHPPVSGERRQLMEQVLKSFRFDGVPTGDAIWAIGLARKKLPPEAEPDQFTREGGSSVYYNTTLKDRNDVLVMFTKHLEGQTEKTWSYRVTETGEVRPVSGKVLVLNNSDHYHGALAEVMAQFKQSSVVATTREPAASALQALPEIQKIADRPIIATMDYTNWFWFSPDGFISGYAIQKGGDKVLKWSLWQ